MKQEIRAMREMLTNMRKEENCLLEGDKTSWNQVMIERSTLLERLYDLRSKRFQATEQLELWAKEAALPFENILCPEDADNCEILSMREQLAALIEKMNDQNMRNISLEAHETTTLTPERLTYSPTRYLPSAKKIKTTVATYPHKP
jgi:hypothetical protein